MQRGGPRIPELLHYCFDASQNLVASRTFRTEVLNTLVKVRERTCLMALPGTFMCTFQVLNLFFSCPCPPLCPVAALQLYLSTGQIDYLNLCRCYQFLDNAPAIASVIVELLAFNQEVCARSWGCVFGGGGCHQPPRVMPLPGAASMWAPWCCCRSKSCWRTRCALTCARTTTKSSWAVSSPCSP